MDGVMRPACGGRKPRRLRAPLPSLLRPLPLMLVLLGFARSQSTTQLRRPCVVDSQATLRCTGDGPDDRSREHVELAGVVSALRDSEVRSAQLYLNLSSAAEHCRAAAVVARSQELVADAARNACDAHAHELRARFDVADRLAASTSIDFRRAADERAALERRVDSTDERLRTLDAGLYVIERSLNETRLKLNATSSNIATVQSETINNVSYLSNFFGSTTYSINEKINASTERMVELFQTANRQDSAITWLNQTQHEFAARWQYQAAALNVQLNTSEGQRVIDMDALRQSTLSRLASIEDRLDNTGSQLKESVDRLSLRYDSLNDSLMSLDIALRRDIQRATAQAESTMLVNERQQVAVMNALRQNTLSRFALIEEDINSTRKQLNDSADHLSLRHNSLNNSLTSLGESLRSDLERVTVMTESTILGVKKEMASNLSSLADAVASLNGSKLISTSASQISELFTIADQLKSILSYLNRTQQENDFTCQRRAWALSTELNLTKLSFHQLREEFGRLRDDNERLIADARNVSAVLRECPIGWQRNGSWCYLLVNGWLGTWNDSRGRCNMMSADLVTVPTAAVNAFLTAYLINYSGTSNFWLGATDVEREGVWRWITGETFLSGLQRRSYSNFAVGEPANSYLGRRIPENCLTMSRLGTWNDMPCNIDFPFFCRMYRP